MSELFASGRIIDLILALIVLEVLLLFGLHARRRHGIVRRGDAGHGKVPYGLLANLLAGTCLLLALRGALTGADWIWPALCLLLALPAHLADLYIRWSRTA